MATRSSRKTKTKYWWETLPEHELLELRFCDLKLKLNDSRVQPYITQLYSELERKRLNFRPHIWISEEWFSADGIPGIAIPFFVVNERLAKLEKKYLLDVEGFSQRECMKLLRHEAGHAIDNAFMLRKSKKRQKLFGLSSTPYPEYYSPQAYSKKYVVHLNSWYAQAHPDEDWAETFAVWLNPKINWKKRYYKWPALSKLKFVDELMQDIADKKPRVKNRECPGSIERSRKKLKTYFQRKRESLCLDEPYYLDPLLQRLFSNDPQYSNKKLAAKFIRDERVLICAMVAKWTGQYRYTINLLLDEVIECCSEKKLRLTNSERETRLDLVGMLTAQALNYISTGRHKIPM
jgi:hypothetical protein